MLTSMSSLDIRWGTHHFMRKVYLRKLIYPIIDLCFEGEWSDHHLHREDMFIELFSQSNHPSSFIDLDPI